MNATKNICFLTSRHRYDDARIYHKEAKTLGDAGYRVTIIAPKQNGIAQSTYIPVVFFKKTRFFRKSSSLFNLIRLGLKTDANCYHCHEGDSSLLAAVLIKFILLLFKNRVTVVYDSHEHWPSSFYDKAPKGLKRLVRLLFSAYEILLAWNVDAIITANDIVKARFDALFPHKPVIRLYNVPSLSLFTPPPSPEKKYTFCHEGNMTFDRGLRVLLNTFSRLYEKRTDWNFLFIGSVKTPNEKKVVENWYESHPGLRTAVSFTGWLPYEDVPGYVQQCRVGGIFFRKSQNNMYGGPPNKLFNYMRYGLPVIAPAFPEIRQIITTYNCGYLFDDLSEKSLVQLFESILSNLDEASEVGKRGRRAVLTSLNWEVESQKLVELYQRMLPLNTTGN
ncbi:MAG: glycosyltransferase family 4 protein [Candidatus Marinimicrobia bacterium]|nr:glycosyltransferase family 4 protein [Candidatus Neomarinimicrobiota bacterium]MCF7828556.1 glycosyltransferase family 4 protein [Candidatus Neomarinimicrobiota bacterium]MCF7880297.1 glycosyltransferase family 4 protein [Candidatus Neomarinimicrobiota bacterium]